MVEDVNDVEICRRLEILMNTEKEDLETKLVNQVFEEGLKFDPRLLPEPYTQYVRHYLYMLKRAKKKEDRGEAEAPVSAGRTPRRKTPRRKKSGVARKKKSGSKKKKATVRKKKSATVKKKKATIARGATRPKKSSPAAKKKKAARKKT